MTISTDEASAVLADIDGVIAKVKQSRVYQSTSATFYLWGATIVIGNVAGMITHRWDGWIWFAIDVCSALITAMVINRGREPGTRAPLRILAAFALFFIFGWMWSVEIGHFTGRQLNAFWPTLFLFGYTLAGLWFGAIFSIVGLALTALILVGYFWSGEWFALWLAVFNGGGLILCGWLMRRA